MNDSDKLDDINAKLNLLIDKMTNLEARITEIEKSTYNMDNHIDFVNMVYDNIKAPFYNALRMFQRTTEPINVDNFIPVLNSSLSRMEIDYNL